MMISGRHSKPAASPLPSPLSVCMSAIAQMRINDDAMHQPLDSSSVSPSHGFAQSINGSTPTPHCKHLHDMIDDHHRGGATIDEGVEVSAASVFSPPRFCQLNPQLESTLSAHSSAVSDTDSEATFSDSAVFSSDAAGFQSVNEFTILQEIGHGASGSVWLALDTELSVHRALKIMPRHRIMARHITEEGGPADAAKIIPEVEILRNLHHPNIVRLIQCIDDPEVEAVYVVMEYVEGAPIVKMAGDMTCQPQPFERIISCAQQLASALAYLHGNGVVHRDVKPDNILADKSGRVLIVDFGLGEVMGQRSHRRHGAVGTLPFMAPEVLSGSKGEAPSDMWSCGVTLYAMLYGKLPFSCKSSKSALIRSILFDEPEYSLHAASAPPPPLVEMIQQLLQKTPEHRATAAGMLSTLCPLSVRTTQVAP